MVTSATQNATKSLRDTATALSVEWSRGRSAIATEEAGIGDPADILARTFRETYEPAAQKVSTTADHLPRNFDRLANVGQAGVDDYQAGDANGKRSMPPPR